MGKYTSSERIQLVIWNRDKGKSVSEICSILNMKRRTVYDILRRYKEENRIDLNHSPGRPKILSQDEERSIVSKVQKNPRLSAPKIVSYVSEKFDKNVGCETVRRVLRNAQYNGRVARKKPFVSEINREKRLNFALEFSLKEDTYWNDVIFADESKFNVFGSDGRVMVWRQPNEEMNPINLKPTVKHGNGSVMVWGCISLHGVGDLVVIEGIMTASRYVELLKGHLKQSAEKMGILKSFKYYEDNDPKHKARLVQEWQLYNCPKVVRPPPQSPDLNPIENVWDELDRRVRQTPVSSKVELEKRLREEWARIDVDYLRKVISNMPNRLRCVIRNNGYPTKY